ncbi:MAG: RNA methyltransferase [Clostridia bacterium]|nr:RNA methyltransferase [Clostridia bacterium]
MVITSIANEKVKLLRSLADAKNRKELGLYVAEGANLVKDIPSPKSVRLLFVKESKQSQFAEIISRFPSEVVVLSDDLFDRVSDTVTPAGIAAVVKIPKTTDISDINDEKIIVLDHVADAGNVGAVLRTAVAAGYKTAVLLGSADPYSPKAVRASMSAIFKINLCFSNNNAFLCSKNIVNYDIMVLDMAGENIFSHVPQRKYALVVGNEAHGVSDEIKAVGRKLSIPMTAMESLNAAVSAGVAMYLLERNQTKQ